MTPPLCTPTQLGLSNNTNCARGGTWFERSQHDKQNNYLPLIDKFIYSPLFHFTSGCPWPMATLKPRCENPGPKVEIPSPKNYGLKTIS